MLTTDARLLAQYDRELRVEITYPEAIKETLPLPSGGTLVRFLRDPGMSFISYTQAKAEDLDALIEAQTAELRARGGPFEWNTCEHDDPALRARLEAHGYTCEEPGPVLFFDLQQAAADGTLERVTAPPPHPGVEVRQLHGAEGIETVISVMERVYGGNFGWMRARIGLHLTLPGYLSMYAAYADGEPACAGWIYYYPGSAFAGLFGGSTTAEQRGGGLYTAVLAARTREAVARGRRYLFIDASEMSRPIVERRGFKVVTWQYSWEAGEA
jgi:hypothetical protein